MDNTAQAETNCPVCNLAIAHWSATAFAILSDVDIEVRKISQFVRGPPLCSMAVEHFFHANRAGCPHK